jgi:hypothetical protein
MLFQRRRRNLRQIQERPDQAGFCLAAKQGNANAQYGLGFRYDASWGVLQNDVLAHRWNNIARASGYYQAAENRTVVEHSMTREQVADAQARACMGRSIRTAIDANAARIILAGLMTGHKARQNPNPCSTCRGEISQSHHHSSPSGQNRARRSSTRISPTSRPSMLRFAKTLP